jgi:MoaA/NifB/PqqE/SkfB family radical SAM enzyme
MFKNLWTKIVKPLIPAPLYHVAGRAGLGKMFKMLFVIGAGYSEIFVYLLRKRGLKAAWTFMGVKLFTPVGPGGAGLFWFIAGPLVRRFPGLYRFPRQVEVEITTKCSKRCIHCEHTWWPTDEQPRKHMTYNEITHILEQFPGLRWVSLVGEGSSFEHPDIYDLIEYVKNREIMCYMVDHLSDWSDKTIAFVMDNDLDGICLSIDAATKETYESLKVGCKFDKVRENIRKLLAEKKRRRSPLPEIMFSYIAMNGNVNEIPDFIDFVASLGRRRDFGVGSRIGIVRLLAFKQILDLQLEEIPQSIIDETHKRGERNELFVNFTGTNKQEKLPEPTYCLAWMEPYIFMDGYISQCCAVFISNNRSFIRKHSLGNLFEGEFREHWNKKPYETLRTYINRPNRPIPIQCAGCRVFNTLPRERKYGIIDTHTGEIMTLEDFYDNYMGENMKWRYQDILQRPPED